MYSSTVRDGGVRCKIDSTDSHHWDFIPIGLTMVKVFLNIILTLKIILTDGQTFANTNLQT